MVFYVKIKPKDIATLIFLENKFRIGKSRFSKIYRGRTLTDSPVQLLSASSSLRRSGAKQFQGDKVPPFVPIEKSLSYLLYFSSIHFNQRVKVLLVIYLAGHLLT